MLEQGIAVPSFSPLVFPMVLIKKKHGSTRFCIDCRKLNDVTTMDAIHLLQMDYFLVALLDAHWFSTLNLQTGFWQVPVNPNHQQKMAFSTSGSQLYKL